MLEVYDVHHRELYSKTSIFVRRHVNEKVTFSKIFTLEGVFETMRFRDRFHWIRVDVRPNQRQKYSFSNKNGSDTYERGLNLDVCP